ncbi:MAG: Lrp/AsnC family transcriptional regulator [Salinigranum sp.]
MPTAIVLLTVEKGGVEPTVDALSEIEDVTEVYSVAGEYDLVAKIQVEEYDRFAEVIPRQFQAIDGIASTETLMAFKTYKL